MFTGQILVVALTKPIMGRLSDQHGRVPIIITGLALGPDAFVRWAMDAFEFADATVTHGAASLIGVERLFAINSALEVDLFGQANVEWRGGRLMSGLGGAPDFARAARRSPGGRAILALPATAARSLSSVASAPRATVVPSGSCNSTTSPPENWPASPVIPAGSSDRRCFTTARTAPASSVSVPAASAA